MTDPRLECDRELYNRNSFGYIYISYHRKLPKGPDSKMHVFAWVSSMELVFFSWTWVFMSHLLDIFVNWIFIRHFGYLTVYGIQHVGFSIVRLYLHRGLQLPVNIEMLWSVTLRSAFYTRQRMTANTIETHSNTIENLKLIWRLPLNRYELNVKIFNSIYFINIYGFTSTLNYKILISSAFIQ